MTSDITALQQRTEPASIVLPPAPAPVPAPLARSTARLDMVLFILLLVLVFLLGSAPAHTSDLWMHLGAGKLLLSGDYHFGADPFAHTTENTYWVIQARLFDALSFLLYTTAS